ncbi:MAG: hypothetical protein QW038_02320 [Nanopusillaceae archaeon]
MYIFTRKYFKSFSSKFFSSFLYSFNPTTIGEFINGSTWMITYALSPLIFYSVIKTYEARSLKNIILYCLLVSILIGLLAGPLWIIIFSILPIPFIMLYNFLCMYDKNLSTFIKKSFLLIAFIILGLILLLPTIYNSLYLKNSAFRAQSIEDYFRNINYCYSKATPLNLLRLAGNAGSPMDMLGYNKINWWSIFGLIIPIIIIIPLLQKSRINCLDLVIYIMIFIIILFIFLTHKKVTYTMFSMFPFLFSLRNPKYLMYPLAFCISFIFGRGIDTLHDFSIKNKLLNKRKKIVITFITATIIISLLIYNFPIMNGRMGLIDDSYIIQKNYYDIINMLNERDDNKSYMILWLPYTYKTQTRLVNNIRHFGIKLGQDVLNDPNLIFAEYLFKIIEKNNSVHFGEIISIFRIRYIVIDKTQNFTEPIRFYKQYNTPFIRGDPNLFNNFIKDQKKFSKIFENEFFIVYENELYLPYISIVNLDKLKKIEENHHIILDDSMKENKYLIRELLSYQYENNTIYLVDMRNIDSFRPIVNYSRDKSTFSFYINISEPSFLTFGESYHPGWIAYANGKELSHWKAFGWANGFLIEDVGKLKIEIKFKPQENRDLMINIWLFSWIIVISMLIIVLVLNSELFKSLSRIGIFGE